MMKDLKHKCSQCGKRFHQPAKLKVHVERVHEGKRKIYSCQHCDSTYSHPSGLKEHIESIHQGVLYMCDYPGCRKTMNRKGNLDAHKKSAHGIERPRTPKSVNISSQCIQTEIQKKKQGKGININKSKISKSGKLRMIYLGILLIH